MHQAAEANTGRSQVRHLLERRAGLSLTTSLVTVTINRGGTLV